MKKLLLITSLLLISIVIFSQTKNVLIADETEYAPSGKSGAFRIISSNDEIVKALIKEFQDRMSKVNTIHKKDRKGYYWEYSLYFPPEEKSNIIEFFKQINK